jgi:hypothetical protein
MSVNVRQRTGAVARARDGRTGRAARTRARARRNTRRLPASTLSRSRSLTPGGSVSASADRHGTTHWPQLNQASVTDKVPERVDEELELGTRCGPLRYPPMQRIGLRPARDGNAGPVSQAQRPGVAGAWRTSGASRRAWRANSASASSAPNTVNEALGTMDTGDSCERMSFFQISQAGFLVCGINVGPPGVGRTCRPGTQCSVRGAQYAVVSAR